MFENALKLTVLAAALAAPLSVAPISGAQAANGGVTFSGNASLTSDYRFRGVSRTEENPALQGGVDADLALGDNLGLYAGTWASTGDGDTIGAGEIDVYGGIAGTSGLANWQVGVIGYLFPDASGLDFYELHGEFGMDFGPMSAAAGLFYAPDQSNLGSRDGVYVYTSLASAVPNTPITLRAGLGYEDRGIWRDKWDWRLGAVAAFRQFTFGVTYVDTNKSARYVTNSGKVRQAGDSTIIFSVGASF